MLNVLPSNKRKQIWEGLNSMQTSVTFKNLPSSEHLKNYVTEKLDRFDRLLDNPAEASVVLSVEKFRHIAEINIVGDRLNIIGKEEINDMYSAIDMVLDKLEKQIKKTSRKQRTQKWSPNPALKKSRSTTRPRLLPEKITEPQLKVMNIEYKPMDIEEAVMQMDLLKQLSGLYQFSNRSR